MCYRALKCGLFFDHHVAINARVQGDRKEQEYGGVGWGMGCAPPIEKNIVNFQVKMQGFMHFFEKLLGAKKQHWVGLNHPPWRDWTCKTHGGSKLFWILVKNARFYVFLLRKTTCGQKPRPESLLTCLAEAEDIKRKRTSWKLSSGIQLNLARENVMWLWYRRLGPADQHHDVSPSSCRPVMT